MAGVAIIDAYVFSLGLGPRPEPQAIEYGTEHNLFTFPFPAATSSKELWKRRRDDVRLVRESRRYLGNKWSALTMARIESYTAKQLITRPWAKKI